MTKLQPQGVASAPFNPVAIAVTMRASFVARAFAGFGDHLADIIQQAIAHRGLALVDILQPCVSFNRVNTFAWYKSRCKELSFDYDPTDWDTAMKKAEEWGERIPIGVIYRNRRVPFDDHFSVVKKGGLVGQEVDRGRLTQIMDRYR